MTTGWRKGKIAVMTARNSRVKKSSMKVTVKKNLIIFHKPGDWFDIYARILSDFGMGMAVRTRLRRELGFTYRTHQHWIEFDSTNSRPRKYCEEQIHLDFFDKKAQTWFQLKYLNLGST